MEPFRAEHAIRKEVNRLTHGRVVVAKVPTANGDFVRDCKGNIILIDTFTHRRWGYIEEKPCPQLMLTPRKRPATA